MSLDDRLKRVEAELAIRNVIARYGLAADCGDVAAALACHTEDATYVVSNPNAGRGDTGADLELSGHAAIADMLRSDMHRSLLPNCAHTVGPLQVEISDKTVRVSGYSRVYHNQSLMRLAVNIWHLHDTDAGWKIARRESRLVGDAAAQTLLQTALSPVEF